MERMNGEVRIGIGYQLYHNISGHIALKGRTPTEKCGIIIGENKWKTVIQNTSRK